MGKPGPAYPAIVAAWPPAPLFRIRIFCSRGSLTPVAAPNVSPNDFLSGSNPIRRSGNDFLLFFGGVRIDGIAGADEVFVAVDVVDASDGGPIFMKVEPWGGEGGDLA